MKKIGLFILLFTVYVVIVFLYLCFCLGNSSFQARESNIIQDMAGFLSFFCFVIGFAWLLVGSIALILHKKSGVSVTKGGVRFIVIAAFGTGYLGFQVTDSLFPIALLTLTIITPSVFLMRKLNHYV